MAPVTIDINADLGESDSVADFELMRYITSANIACGGHAGDEHTMTQALKAAKRLHVAVGAHPGYPDRKNFGRLELPMAANEVEEFVYQQVVTLSALANDLGLKLSHVKPHGALYHAASRGGSVALALGSAVKAIDPNLIIIGQSASASLETWRAQGLSCAAEAFADRTYEADGTLRKRTLPGALIESPEAAAQQALGIALRKLVRLPSGSMLPVGAETICIHSDTPGAADIARAVRERLEAAGISVKPLRRHQAFDG
jgi:5-oxoprolinase (ATP-hydrolysing) subunit A